MSIDSMKEHYESAIKNYESANRALDERTKEAYQKAGDTEYNKACEEAEKAKEDIRIESCKEAKVYYDKSAEFYEKGDLRLAKEYQEKGDKVMSVAKEKENEIKKEGEKASLQIKSAKDGLEKTKYYRY